MKFFKKSFHTHDFLMISQTNRCMPSPMGRFKALLYEVLLSIHEGWNVENFTLNLMLDEIYIYMQNSSQRNEKPAAYWLSVSLSHTLSVGGWWGFTHSMNGQASLQLIMLWSCTWATNNSYRFTNPNNVLIWMGVWVGFRKPVWFPVKKKYLRVEILF